MPELPDVTIYIEALSARMIGAPIEKLRLASPFVLRTVSPRPDAIAGRVVRTIARMGKRIVMGLEGGMFVAVHLMRAGRFRWNEERGAKIPGKLGLAAFDVGGANAGTLILTEAGSKRRASIHIFASATDLAALDPGGLEPLDSTVDEFAAVLARENHTLKRSLTDPHLFSGIGNAYSDEILHAAKLSPVRLTSQLSRDEIVRLHRATIDTLNAWTDRLRVDLGVAAGRFPEKVTAFRDGMAVHGRYAEPCPVCGARVQRIRYAENETNYCATCQTGGKLLADRSLSRLLKGDWPKTVDEMEERRAPARAASPEASPPTATHKRPSSRG